MSNEKKIFTLEELAQINRAYFSAPAPKFTKVTRVTFYSDLLKVQVLIEIERRGKVTFRLKFIRENGKIATAPASIYSPGSNLDELQNVVLADAADFNLLNDHLEPDNDNADA